MPRQRRIVHPVPDGAPGFLMRQVDAMGYPPRGLGHAEAARYVGVGENKFDEMIEAKAMPVPKMIGKRLVWDRIELDLAFNELPKKAENPAKTALLATRKTG